MTTFFLIRHGSCDGLGQTLWGRTKGVRLNEKGKLEARQLIERFRGTTLDAIYSSPLERAFETAETIARELKLGDEVVNSALKSGANRFPVGLGRERNRNGGSNRRGRESRMHAVLRLG